MNLKENNSPISLSSLNSFSTAIFHPQRSITLSIHDGILKKLKLSESLKLISSLSHRLSVFLSRHFYSWRHLLNPNPQGWPFFSLLRHHTGCMVHRSTHKTTGKSFKSLGPFFFTYFTITSMLDLSSSIDRAFLTTCNSTTNLWNPSSSATIIAYKQPLTSAVVVLAT